MLVSRIIYYIVRLLSSTYRYRFLGVENLAEACGECKTGNYIFGIWHQNLFQGILCQKGRAHVVIVSKSKDADPVSFTCQRLGHKVMRGSSKNASGVDKGGKAAKDEMIEALKLGFPGAITVDGPKGPAQIVKAGIIDMARKTQIPIIPYLPIPLSHWTFNSWDKFRLPKPFSKIIVAYGKPIFVAPETADEGFAKIQDELRLCLNENEAMVRDNFKNWDKLAKNNFVWEGH